jgi:hypothetical protein
MTPALLRKDLKPLPPLTRFLTVLLKLYFAILIISLIGDIYSWYEYSDFAPGVDVDEILLASDVFNLIVGIIQLSFIAFLGVTFLRWIYRVNMNLHILSSAPMEYTPGWSIGWYFIPIANLYQPYKAMKEIWNVANIGKPGDSAIIRWWWAFWIISNIICQIAAKLALKTDNVRSNTLSAIANGASDGFYIILTYIALLLVTAVSKAYCSNFIESPVLPASESATQIRFRTPYLRT